MGEATGAGDEPREAIHDLPALLALRAALARLDPALPPTALIAQPARAAGGADTPAGAVVGILAGSFDPLTNAHGALARAALDTGGLDALYFALSRRTVDKEGLQRPSQADRALVLRRYARRHPRHGVLLFNRGLYAEQAAAARGAFPAARELAFVVGFDKARQIFDPRYYDDRDAALGELFDAVTLLVAPRGGDGEAELAALLDRPENRPYRARVRPLPFDPAYAGDSATQVREAARAGQSVAGLVPPETLAFLAEARPYDPQRRDASGALIDPYARREALLDALEANRVGAGDECSTAATTHPGSKRHTEG